MLEGIFYVIVTYPYIAIPVIMLSIAVFDYFSAFLTSRILNMPILKVYYASICARGVFLIPYILTSDDIESYRREITNLSSSSLIRKIVHHSLVPGFVEELFFRYVPGLASFSISSLTPLIITNIAWIFAHIGTFKTSVLAGVDVSDVKTIFKLFIPSAIFTYGYSALAFTLILLAYMTYNNFILAYIVPAITHTIYNMLTLVSLHKILEYSRHELDFLILDREEESYWSI